MSIPVLIILLVELIYTVSAKTNKSRSISVFGVLETGTPVLNDFEDHQCYNKWFCHKGPATGLPPAFPEKNCHCDNRCEMFQDCCIDFTTEDIVLSLIPKMKTMVAYTECVYLEEADLVYGFEMVNRCPSNMSRHGEQIQRLCESTGDVDLFLKVPVMGRANHIYKNAYCAICHDDVAIYWSARADCGNGTSVRNEMTNVTLDEILENNDCRVYFEPPLSVSPRFCFPHVVDSCRANKNDVLESSEKYSEFSVSGFENSCRNGPYALVYTEDRAYKNIYCAWCNYRHSNVSCEPNITASGQSPDTRRSDLYSFQLLLNLNSASTRLFESGKFSAKKSFKHALCRTGEVYDPFSKVCRSLVKPEPPASADISRVSVYSLDNKPDVTPCSLVRLDPDEYTNASDVDGKYVFVPAHRTRYRHSQIQFHNSSIVLCTNFTQNNSSPRYSTVAGNSIMFSFSETESVISFIGTLLSVLALFVNFIVYACLRQLHNTPGKTLMSLVAALFLANLTFLVAPSLTPGHLGCCIIAVVMHYYFLAAFFWMNSMAVDLFLTFTAKFVPMSGRKSSGKRFYLYSLYSWACPLVIVGVSLCLDQLVTKSSYAPNYGQFVCWISSENGLLVFFALPVFLLTLTNVILFIWTGRNLYVSVRESAQILGRKDKCKFIIHVKLTFVMGLTWVFGFIAKLADISVLWYVFIILNTLQGLLICICFIFTRKVYRLLVHKMGEVRSWVTGGTDSTVLTSSSRPDAKTNLHAI